MIFTFFRLYFEDQGGNGGKIYAGWNVLNLSRENSKKENRNKNTYVNIYIYIYK